MTDTKSFGIVDVDIKATTDDEGVADGSFEAILSAPTLDRDGEVIDGRAFDPLPDHITIDIDHGMSVGTTVGSGTPYYEGDVLKFRGTFSSIPRAQEVRTLVTEGHIRKMSVAFMNASRETDPDDERTHIRRAELLNAAIVPIPSNREASILAAKALAAEVHQRALEDDDTKTSTDTDPEQAAAPAAADAPAEVAVDPKALAALAEAEALLA
jgi:HK97 family phage prohead protease